jgi:2'-5' RNA ligase
MAAWKKDTNIHLTSAFWPDIDGQNYKSINVLFTEFDVKLVKITVDGRVIFRN